MFWDTDCAKYKIKWLQGQRSGAENVDNLVARAEHDFFGFCPSLSINKGCLQEGCIIV